MADEEQLVFVKDAESVSCDHALVGGKARNLWLLGRLVGCPVPRWFALTTAAFTRFVEHNNLTHSLAIDPADLPASTEVIHDRIMAGSWPDDLLTVLQEHLSASPFADSFVAVRSSGTDEDSAAHSFAGQFESYLFQRGENTVMAAIKRCWSSCFSERVMSHRVEVGAVTTGLKMAVIVQVMVNSSVSGVAFSRHPLKPISSDSVFIEAVYGLGEGLVGGELEADRYEVSRQSLDVVAVVADKDEMFVQCKEEGGLEKVAVQDVMVKKQALTNEQAVTIARLMMELEDKMKKPQDFEWGIENDQLYCLQARPIVTLPPSCFFDQSVPGQQPTLWDNSNIVESYSGVTSPLTFSFASYAYEKVYTLTLLAAGVPASVVADLKPSLSNMLGLVRGNIYYNLISWYRCLACLPVGDVSKFMDTMMGVKQSLGPEIEAQFGSIRDSAPKYSVWTKIRLGMAIIHRVYYMDHLVQQFFSNFNHHYHRALDTDFTSLSLQQQVAYIKDLYENVLGRWLIPIYNDTYVMLFFGLLQKLVSSYLSVDIEKAKTLQNDLLCGQGDVESTEPTKMLMRIAEYIDSSPADVRDWFMQDRRGVLDLLAQEQGRVEEDKRRADRQTMEAGPTSGGLRQRTRPSSEQTHPPSEGCPFHQPQDLSYLQSEVVKSIQRFLDRYGFRCINELKLEESTLHDDPEFVLDMISGYIRTQSYSINNMEERETLIRQKAEQLVNSSVSWPKRVLINWVLYHARRGVKHRENMRFARTKLFGVFRSLFRAIGVNMVQLGLLAERQDVFYLTVEEIISFVEGRSVTNDLAGLVSLRKREYGGYQKGIAPPERFITKGACGAHFLFPQILSDLDMLKELEAEASADPNVLSGTSCCPGVVEGVVRVVTSVNEAKGLAGEILVTGRTDPGWVPLYPMCSGLVIERGSLLSHSAVVARELGLPTIVGVSGGLMKRLKTGMRVHMDAGKGRVTILHDNEDHVNE